MTFVYIAIGITGLLSFLVLHIILWQVLKTKNSFILTATAAAGFAAAAACASWLLNIPALAHLPVSTPVFMFLAVTYFHFYYGIDRSVSVRTLGVLASSKERRMTLAQLDAIYPKEEMVRRRLAIMVEYGWLTEKDGAYHCT